MAYQTPKTNWAANQGVAYTDLNRIEGNIDAIRKSHIVSGCIGGYDGTADLAPEEETTRQVVTIEVPSGGSSLYLRRVSHYIAAGSNTEHARLQVYVTDTGGTPLYTYTSSDDKDQESPNGLIYTNNTAFAVYVYVAIRIYNSSGSLTVSNLFPYSGWEVLLDFA